MTSTNFHQTSKSSSRMLSIFSVIFIWTSVDCWSYHYSNNTMNWPQARAWCQERYTDMVAIQNQEEITHLMSLPRKPTYYWIGIRKINNVWTWVGTKKPLTKEAENWAKNEPNNGHKSSMGSEDCVEMYIQRETEEGKWNDERCGKLKTALCYSADCKNDSCIFGECVEKINSHECQCHDGFHGDRCENVFFCKSDEVTVPDNGNVSCVHKYGDFAFGSECQYSCEEGYQLSAPGLLKCNADKTWSDQPPTCELIKCPKLSDPEKGSINCSHPLGPSSYRSTCVFACDEGYVLTGSQSDTLTCDPVGQWDGTQPSCTAVQCPVLSEQYNLITTCDNTENGTLSFGESCSFRCATGFTLVGVDTITCTSSAEWSDSMPFCQAVECPALKNPENGVAVCGDDPETKFIYENMCSFKCLPGYELVGATEVTCTSESEWSDSPPHCEVIKCPKLSDPEKGSINCSHPLGPSSYRSTCVFACDEGYVLTGSQSDTLTCDPEGQWDATQPSCAAVQCPVLSEQYNLITTCDNTENGTFSFGESCSFRCATGFTLVGADTITCTSSAEWSDSMPFCQAVQCPALKNPENGVAVCGNDPETKFIYENMCSYECLPGYELVGATEVTCTSEAEWSDSPPHCEAVQCPALLEQQNLIMTCEDTGNAAFSFGKSCSFSCASGFTLVGVDTITCTSSAEWSDSLPHCEAVHCPAIPEMENIFVTCEEDAESKFIYGNSCSFSCTSGYRLVGTKTLTCTASAEWNGSLPHCQVMVCPALEKQPNLIMNCSSDRSGLVPGSTCSFDCETGSVLRGAETITCSAEARWDQSTPNCEVIVCPLLEAPQNGHINCSSPTEPLYNSHCTFSCGQDYTLDGLTTLTCGHFGNWTGDVPTCQPGPSQKTLIASGVAAGGAVSLSGLSLAMWILRKLKRRASKFDLSSSDIEVPPQVYRNSLSDSLL